MLKHVFTFLLLICFISCNNVKSDIELTTYLLSVRGIDNYVSELPRSGITIKIDTLTKKIHIPLAGIVKDETLNTQILVNEIPFYDPKTQSIDLVIEDMEQKPEGILFFIQSNKEKIECVSGDIFFSIRIEKGNHYMFVGGEEAQRMNSEMNDAKQMVFDSLTGY